MNKSVEVSKTSGAHAFAGGKDHEKPAHSHGPVDTGKHEQPLKSDGAHVRKDKPLVHVEDVNHHNGRLHPPASKLADSKVLGGKLRKSNN